MCTMSTQYSIVDKEGRINHTVEELVQEVDRIVQTDMGGIIVYIDGYLEGLVEEGFDNDPDLKVLKPEYEREFFGRIRTILRERLCYLYDWEELVMEADNDFKSLQYNEYYSYDRYSHEAMEPLKRNLMYDVYVKCMSGSSPWMFVRGKTFQQYDRDLHPATIFWPNNETVFKPYTLREQALYKIVVTKQYKKYNLKKLDACLRCLKDKSTIKAAINYQIKSIRINMRSIIIMHMRGAHPHPSSPKFIYFHEILDQIEKEPHNLHLTCECHYRQYSHCACMNCPVCRTIEASFIMKDPEIESHPLFRGHHITCEKI